MELEYSPDEESDNVLPFCKTLNDSTELCLICHVDEREDGEKYDRYQLICGHVGHTRCMRRWCHVKQGVNCPLCGDLDRQKVKEKLLKKRPGFPIDDLVRYEMHLQRLPRKQAIDCVLPFFLIK